MPDDQGGAIEVRFPGLSPAEASALARELEAEFLHDGASAGQVRIARGNAETMDFGATLLIGGAGVLGWEFVKGAAKGAGTKLGEAAGREIHEALRRKIDAFCLRRRAAAQVAVPGQGTWYLRSEFEHAEDAAVPSDLGTLGVVILGASVFPHMQGLDNPAFARSAAAARGLFASPGPLFREAAVLDLFDQDRAPLGIADAIEAHIDEHPDMADLLLYYCGHGDFLPDRTHFLTLRGTRKGRESLTGLKLGDLRHTLEAKLANRRFYLILDCCYAGASVREFMGPNVAPGVERAVHEALPPGGWVVLTAASSSVPAMAPAGRDLTMFTGALAQVLGEAARPLSFDDIAMEARRVIRGTYGAAGVLPECHAPRQVGGDLRRTALFGGRAVPPALVPSALPVIWGSERVERPVAPNPAPIQKAPERVEPPGLWKRLFGAPAPAVQALPVIWPDPPRPIPVVPPVARSLVPIPEMVLIPAGRFCMGIPSAETAREGNPASDNQARPLHEVTIPRPFWLGKYPVTWGEYAAFIDETGERPVDDGAYGWIDGKWETSKDFSWRRPGFDQTDRHPVVCVSHGDAEAYCAWLSQKTGETWRLASEAEWEHAARAGTTTARYWGDAAGNPGEHAHFFGSAMGTLPVGSFRPNTFDLYDMLGNVWEWTADHWHDDYKGAPVDGSVWTTIGSNEGRRVLRGASWIINPGSVRAGHRDGSVTVYRDSDAGLRVARTYLRP